MVKGLESTVSMPNIQYTLLGSCNSTGCLQPPLVSSTRLNYFPLNREPKGTIHFQDFECYEIALVNPCSGTTPHLSGAGARTQMQTRVTVQ